MAEATAEATSTTDQAKEKASEVAGQAQEKAQEVAGQARDRVRTQVDERTTQIGEQVGGTAGDIRSLSEELRKQGKDQPAKYAEQAADKAEQLGGYLKRADADRLLSDIEDFGRRQPWAVALGGLALGFAASRFLKASSTQRFERASSSYYSQPHPSGANGDGYDAVRSPELPLGGSRG